MSLIDSTTDHFTAAGSSIIEAPRVLAPAVNTSAERETTVARLIKERLLWVQPAENCEPSIAINTVSAFKQLIEHNVTINTSLEAAAESTCPPPLEMEQHRLLEEIWKKQLHKSSLFGGKSLPSAQLSVHEVRLGTATLY